MQNATSTTRRLRSVVLVLCACQAAGAAGCAAPARPSLQTLIAAQTPLVASPLATDALTALRQDLLTATDAAGVRHAAWGVVVQSLDRNERLFELNPHMLLVPASTAKLLSVATAADSVGWDYRFETDVTTNGRLAGGVLDGDLIVVGSGDPSLGGRGGDDVSALVDAVTALGIRRVTGRVIGDDDALEEPRPAFAWAWDDLGYATGALFGALNLSENRMVVTVTPGTTPDAPTTLGVDPSASGRPLVNRTVTVARGGAQLIWPEQRPGEAALTIAGTIPVRAAPARLTVSAGNPTAWFASVFRTRLMAAGIEVTGAAADIDDLAAPPAPASTTLVRYRSRPLGEIVQPLLKESINLYAEAVMRLNVAPGVFPTNDAALDGFKARLAAWGLTDGAQYVDGSGLSRRDVVTADALVAVLQRMYDPTGASPWMRALPIAGVDGSLENRMKGTAAERNVRAKTGTMSNIRSLAGYVTTADGEHLAFAALVNNFEGPGATALRALDTMAERLARFRR